MEFDSIRKAVRSKLRALRDRMMGDKGAAPAPREKAPAPQEPDTTDVLLVLKRDHEQVAGLFERLESLEGPQREAREDLFAQILYELDVHASAEEKLFYPALREAGAGDLIKEALDEHASMKQLLTELFTMAVDDPRWTDQVKALRQVVEHHVKEEEGEVFARARESFPEERRRELGAQVQAAKEAQTQLSQESDEEPSAAAV